MLENMSTRGLRNIAFAAPRTHGLRKRQIKTSDKLKKSIVIYEEGKLGK